MSTLAAARRPARPRPPLSEAAGVAIASGADVASRRTFLAAALAASALPVAGVFAGGEQRLRVGLVGCGGRGTGAALQAAAADAAVRIVALGDLFSDQLAASADLLARGIGPQFDCPPARRFVGELAFRDVIDSGVDVVVLATPPHARPQHLEAAVAAGCHVYCEKPVAVDVTGVLRAAAAASRSRAMGLALVSGFCFRHDVAMRELVARIQGGAIGRPLALHAHAAIGLPWRQPPRPGDSAEATRHRNWISRAALSGGHFVEHHVEAIDRALWILGDAEPVVAEPLVSVRGVGDPVPSGDCPAGTAACYRFADGSTLEAMLERRERPCDRVEEFVVGASGTADLIEAIVGGMPLAARPGGPGRHRNAMRALVRGILTGRPVHEGHAMCRSTATAIMGRMACDNGRRVAWSEIAAGPSFPA